MVEEVSLHDAAIMFVTCTMSRALRRELASLLFSTQARYLSASFLGGLSLHLNHLIASGMTIYNWPFGTLPFRLFGSNLDTRDLETYPRTYSGHF